jgi:hypothetical protein
MVLWNFLFEENYDAISINFLAFFGCNTIYDFNQFWKVLSSKNENENIDACLTLNSSKSI